VPTELEIARLVARATREEGGDALFIGSVAANVYGRPRASSDIDVLLRLPPTSFRRWAAGLRRQGLTVDPKDVSDAEREGGHVTVHDLSSGTHVDAKLATGAEDEQFARGLLLENGVTVAGLEDVIAHKFRFGRRQDLLDIENMLEMSGDRVDEGRLRRIMKSLGLSFRRYQRLRARRGPGTKPRKRVVRKA
jgi:hypothetical protein